MRDQGQRGAEPPRQQAAAGSSARSSNDDLEQALRDVPENQFKGVKQAERGRFDDFHSGASAQADGGKGKGIRRGA
eukprot:10534016-Alexandrium_andersonii.AAC.1